METACSLLEAGTEFAAMAKSDYTALLFMLSKGMVRFIYNGFVSHENWLFAYSNNKDTDQLG